MVASSVKLSAQAFSDCACMLCEGPIAARRSCARTCRRLAQRDTAHTMRPSSTLACLLASALALRVSGRQILVGGTDGWTRTRLYEPINAEINDELASAQSSRPVTAFATCVCCTAEAPDTALQQRGLPAQG